MNVTLKLAESLLDLVATTHPKLSIPSDVDSYVYSTNTDPIDVSAGIEPVYFSLVFNNAVAEQVGIELCLAEPGHFCDKGFSYGIFSVTDCDSDVFSRVGAFISNDEGRTFTLELAEPVVCGLIGANSQCTLADRVRFATYLVRLGSDAVSRYGCSEGFLSYAVGFLRLAVCDYRDAQADSSDDGSGNAGDDSPFHVASLSGGDS